MALMLPLDKARLFLHLFPLSTLSSFSPGSTLFCLSFAIFLKFGGLHNDLFFSFMVLWIERAKLDASWI